MMKKKKKLEMNQTLSTVTITIYFKNADQENHIYFQNKYKDNNDTTLD